MREALRGGLGLRRLVILAFITFILLILSLVTNVLAFIFLFKNYVYLIFNVIKYLNEAVSTSVINSSAIAVVCNESAICSICGNCTLPNKAVTNFNYAMLAYLLTPISYFMFFLFYILYLHSVRALLTYEESDRDVVLSQRPWSIAHAFHVDAFGLLIIEWGGFIVSQAFFIALFIIGYPMSIFPSYEYDALCRVFPCSELPSVIEAVLFGVEITLVIIAVLIERGGEYEVEELCREGGSGKENVLERINKFLSRFGLHRFEVYAVRILRIVVIIMILISIPLSIGLMIPAFISRAALSVYLSATFMMFAVILLAGVIMFILEMFVRVRVHELCRSRPTKPETLENRLGLF